MATKALDRQRWDGLWPFCIRSETECPDADIRRNDATPERESKHTAGYSLAPGQPRAGANERRRPVSVACDLESCFRRNPVRIAVVMLGSQAKRLICVRSRPTLD